MTSSVCVDHVTAVFCSSVPGQVSYRSSGSKRSVQHLYNTRMSSPSAPNEDNPPPYPGPPNQGSSPHNPAYPPYPPHGEKSAAYPPTSEGYGGAPYPPSQPYPPPPQQHQPQPGQQYPPPPPPGYPQQGYGPQVVTNQPGTTTIVTTAVMGQQFRECPVNTVCPHCQAQVVTAVQYETGTLAWVICAVVCIMGADCGCCLIPFCVDGCKDVIHSCPNCKQIIHRWNRL